MNRTLNDFYQFAKDPETEKLFNVLDEATDDHRNGTVLAALIRLLMVVHLDSIQDDDGSIDLMFANQCFVELAQTLRVVQDNLLSEDRE